MKILKFIDEKCCCCLRKTRVKKAIDKATLKMSRIRASVIFRAERPHRNLTILSFPSTDKVVEVVDQPEFENELSVGEENVSVAPVSPNTSQIQGSNKILSQPVSLHHISPTSPQSLSHDIFSLNNPSSFDNLLKNIETKKKSIRIAAKKLSLIGKEEYNVITEEDNPKIASSPGFSENYEK